MPVFETSQLKYLSDHSANIRPEFTQGLLNLKTHIVNNAKVKEVLNGKMFSSLIQSFCIEMNTKNVPNLGSAWDSIVKQQIELSFDKISILSQE